MSKKPQVEGWYDQIVRQNTPPRPVLKNCLLAFLAGGLLCGLAQAGNFALVNYANLPEQEASGIVMMVVIILAALLTGLGYYDKLAQRVGAGVAVPISGFANSVVASCMEHRAEGFVLGSGSNSFKLAGSVIMFGIFSAGFMVLVRLIFGLI